MKTMSTAKALKILGTTLKEALRNYRADHVTGESFSAWVQGHAQDSLFNANDSYYSA